MCLRNATCLGNSHNIHALYIIGATIMGIGGDPVPPNFLNPGATDALDPQLLKMDIN